MCKGNRKIWGQFKFGILLHEIAGSIQEQGLLIEIQGLMHYYAENSKLQYPNSKEQWFNFLQILNTYKHLSPHFQFLESVDISQPSKVMASLGKQVKNIGVIKAVT